MRLAPTLLSLPLAAVLIAVPAVAPAAEDGLALFRVLDRDGNGAISTAEIAAVRAEAFDRIDTDGDGRVTRAELEAPRSKTPAPAGNPIRQRDKDGDGQLSRAEFIAPQTGFTRADRNRDGALSPDEFARVAQFFARVSD